MYRIMINIVIPMLILVWSKNTLAQYLEKQMIQSHKPCRNDKDCLPNSFCHGNDDDRVGSCKCEPGFELQRFNGTAYECYTPSKLGGPCTQDYHCAVILGDLAECDQFHKTCGCRKNYAHADQDNGQCYKTVNLTDVCISDKNCKLDNNGYAFCADGRCTCPHQSQRPSLNKRECITAKKLGEICASDTECQFTPNTRCVEVCDCQVRYAVSRNGASCLKAALEFGEPCVEDDQCGRYLVDSVCVKGGFCGCPPGKHPHLTRCERSALLSQPCRDAAECEIKPSFRGKVDCVEGVCRCHPGVIDAAHGCNNAPVQIAQSLLVGFLGLLLIFLSS